MTLDEAIKHEEEAAEKNEKKAKSYPRPDRSVRGSGRKYNDCIECASEHRQLAEWLKELKQLREQEPCEDCISRQAVLDQTYLWSRDEFLRVTNPFDYLRKRINSLPFVTSEEKVSRSENPNKLIPVSEELSNNDAALCDNCPCKTDTCQEGLHCPMDE